MFAQELDRTIRSVGQSVATFRETATNTIQSPVNEISAHPGLLLKRPLKYALDHALIPLAKNAAGRGLPHIFNPGVEMIEYQNLEPALDKAAGMVNKGDLLIVEIGHISLADILVYIKLAPEIKSRIPWVETFHTPISASLMRGIQGFLPQLLYAEGAVPLITGQHCRPLSTVTENDKDVRGLTPTRDEKEQLLNAAKDKSGAFLVFAEGTVDAGRYDALGHMKGMREVVNPFLPTISKVAHKEGRRVIILPVATTGTNRMLSADSRFLTWRGVGALFEYYILRKTPMLARAIIGEPFEIGDDLWAHPEKINETVMSEVAKLKPIEEQGFYNPRTKEYRARMKAYTDRPDTVRPKWWNRFLFGSPIFPIPSELHEIAAKYPTEEPKELPTAA